MLNLIPGYNTAKNIMSGAIGLMFGAGLMSIVNYSKRREQKKEMDFLKEEIEALKERISQTDFKAQEKAIIKVGLLKQLAWIDDELHDKEYKFIVEYIIDNKFLESDVKIMLIKNIKEAPPLLDTFFESIASIFSKKHLKFFDSEEEKMGFIAILEQLRQADDAIHKKEIQFIKRLKNL